MSCTSICHEFEYSIVYFVSFYIYIYVLKQFKIVNLISKPKKKSKDEDSRAKKYLYVALCISSTTLLEGVYLNSKIFCVFRFANLI